MFDKINLLTYYINLEIMECDLIVWKVFHVDIMLEQYTPKCAFIEQVFNHLLDRFPTTFYRHVIPPGGPTAVLRSDGCEEVCESVGANRPEAARKERPSHVAGQPY